MKSNTLIMVVLAFSLNLISQNINKGTVGYWPLDCNTLDSTDNKIHGIVPDGSSPSCTIGKLNGAYYFDGENDFIEFSKERSNELISPKGFTWSLWFQLDSLPPQGAIDGIFMTMISVCGPANNEDIYMGIGSLTARQNELAFVVDGKGGFGESASNNGADLGHKPENGFSKDSIYHICGIRDYDSSKVELYFNGIKVASATYSGEIEPLQGNFNAQLGRFYDGRDASGEYKGMLDEVRVFDRVLTEEEVLILFSARPEQLSVESNTVNFGNIECQDSGTQILEIFNQGPSLFIIDDMDFTDGSYFSASPSTYTLVNQESKPFIIEFNPPSKGLFYDTLLISNPYGVQPFIIYLEGEKNVEISIANEVDFGELVNCEQEKTLTARISINNGHFNEGLELGEVFVQGADIVIDDSQTLPVGISSLVSMTFTPFSSGTFSETATITFDNCDVSYTFTVKAKKTDFIPVIEDLDFGMSAIGEKKVAEMQIINDGSTTFTINDIQIIEGTEFSFDDLSFVRSENLLPGNSYSFNIAYVPISPNANGLLEVELESLCGIYKDTLSISGNGTYKTTFDMRFQDLNVRVGETKRPILELTNITQFDISDVDTIYFSLKLNHTVANPANSYTLRTQEDQFYSSYIIAVIPEKVNTNQQIEISEYIFTLGNESFPIFEITDVWYKNGFADINIAQPGKIILEDLCEDGQVRRLFYSDHWLELGNVSPNPASNEFNLTFTLIEPGFTRFYLVDASGNLVKEFVNDYLSEGTYEGTYNISDIKMGTYFYVLETPNHFLNNQFVKVK